MRGQAEIEGIAKECLALQGRMLEELKGLGGKILMTSLSHEDKAKLQAALSAAKS